MANTLVTMPRDFTGLSYESAQLGHPDFFSASNTALIGLFKRLTPEGVLRIGGNTEEYTTWSANDADARFYLDDLHVGQRFISPTHALDEAQIIAFAKQYDPQPFHVDPVAAKDGPYGGLIASGWQTTAKMMRLLVEHFVSPESGLGAAGVDEVRWPRPVRPGDTLHVRATVLEARRSNSKPDRGIIRSLAELTNQDGELVMKLTAINFVLLKGPDA